MHRISSTHQISNSQISRRARVRTPGPKPGRLVEKAWSATDWALTSDDAAVDARGHGRYVDSERQDRVVTRSPSRVKERRWSASNAGQNKKWRSTNSSFDVFDKLMVRAERGGKMGRQLSLDGPQRPVLRRQTSEDLRPGPLKIAWAADHLEQPSVEVVAKKCGQPKPSIVKPPRSPYHSDETAAVVYSRQQLTERLRSSWKKSSGRHNLNIFINQSVESETDSVSEAVDSPLTRSPSSSDGEGDGGDAFRDPAPEPTPKDRDKSLGACASDRRLAFRMMGRQSKILDSPCATPEVTKGTAAPMRRMMSAPSRPPSKKLTKAATVESRVKSAPSKRKHKPPQPRRKAKGDSSDDEKSGTRRVKRGVEKGEIVTMVSLVSPAESEEEATPAPTPDLKPPTPKPPPESPRPNPPPPPPILSLRKPVKAVSFRPVVQPQPSSTQYQTTFPLKRTLTHQNTISSSSGVGSRPQLQRQATLPPSSSSPVPTAPRPATAPRPPPTISKTTETASTPDPQSDPPGDHPGAVTRDHPAGMARDHQSEGSPRPSTSARVQRKSSVALHPPSTVRRKIIQATLSVIKLEPEPIKEAELSLPCVPESAKKPEEINQDLEVEVSDKPVFKNSKEKECWALFKKMSDRGVSVTFETVLRGLLTPTEYRMRRAALMSVC